MVAYAQKHFDRWVFIKRMENWWFFLQTFNMSVSVRRKKSMCPANVTSASSPFQVQNWINFQFSNEAKRKKNTVANLVNNKPCYARKKATTTPTIHSTFFRNNFYSIPIKIAWNLLLSQLRRLPEITAKSNVQSATMSQWKKVNESKCISKRRHNLSFGYKNRLFLYALRIGTTRSNTVIASQQSRFLFCFFLCCDRSLFHSPRLAFIESEFSIAKNIGLASSLIFSVSQSKLTNFVELHFSAVQM